MRRLAAWWRHLIDRDTHGTHYAAWLTSLRDQLRETERELAAHVASWAPIYAGPQNPSDHPAHARTMRLQARIRDLRALIQEHA